MNDPIKKYFDELYNLKVAEINAEFDKKMKEKDELHAKKMKAKDMELKEKDELYAKELEESGILAAINALKGMNCNDQTIIDQIMKNFNLNLEQAQEYIANYYPKWVIIQSKIR